MVVLEINNSYCQVKGLTIKDFNALRKLLSYTIDATAAFHSKSMYNRTRYCIDKHGVFATGLLARVETFLVKSNINYDIVNLRTIPITGAYDHKFSSKLDPYVDQKLAATKAWCAGRGIVSMPTGTGKSLVIALITAQFGLRTLIVVPTLQIKEQLITTFKTMFKDMSNIAIENIDSSALKKAKNYDLLIIDEAHHVAAKTYHNLNKTAWTGIYYRFFLTATPFRNDTEETLLFEGIAGQVVYSLSYKDAVAKGYIVPVEAYYIEAPKILNDYYSWSEVNSKLITNNEQKNDLLCKLLLTLSLNKKSTLCLVREIKHGTIIEENTGIPFANGQDDTTRVYIDKFNQAKIHLLTGTEGVIGEGVDTKPCEYVVIAAGGKAKSAFMQKVGRCVRTHPGKESGKVILILDRSHKFLLRHYREQVKILKDEYGITNITRLEL